MSTPIVFSEHVSADGRVFVVPDQLFRLPVWQALAVVRLPPHLWSPGVPSVLDLADRTQRARYYEILLREGGPEDLLAHVDGALLVDLWPELALEDEIRHAWEPVVRAATTAPDTVGHGRSESRPLGTVPG
ncbi:MAG TPA: hypothetical protein VIL00_16140 [Pseudonocardiaceae bacterium]